MPAHLVGDRQRLAGRVVVAHEHAVALGDEPVVAVAAHLELEPEARPAQLARPDEDADVLVERRRRAVVDVALGEDEPEPAPASGRVAGQRPLHVRDPRCLEVAQELDVVEVTHRVEVAEAHALDDREVAHRLTGIWIRAIALTRNQNSVPARAMTASATAASPTPFAPTRASAAPTTVSARII